MPIAPGEIWTVPLEAGKRTAKDYLHALKLTKLLGWVVPPEELQPSPESAAAFLRHHADEKLVRALTNFYAEARKGRRYRWGAWRYRDNSFTYVEKGDGTVITIQVYTRTGQLIWVCVETTVIQPATQSVARFCREAERHRDRMGQHLACSKYELTPNFMLVESMGGPRTMDHFVLRETVTRDGSPQVLSLRYIVGGIVKGEL